jgi:hypothetical protein
MADQASSRFLRAVRNHAIKTTRYHAPPMERYAVVLKTKPLKIAMLDSRIMYEEELDEFYLSAWLRRYDADHEIQKGDTLIIGTLPSGELIAKDCVTRKHVTKGVRTDSYEVWGETDPEVLKTDIGNMLFTIDVHDSQSRKIGVSPVYDEDSLHESRATATTPASYSTDHGEVVATWEVRTRYPEDQLIGVVLVYDPESLHHSHGIEHYE